MAHPPGYDEWFTPSAFVQALGAFDLDPCAGPMAHAAENWTEGGLEKEWRGRVWLNPPFSNIQPWIKKLQAHGNGIVLIQARVKTRWVLNLIADAGAILLPTGRVYFTRPNRPPSELPSGILLAAFGAENVEALKESGLGMVLRPISL